MAETRATLYVWPDGRMLVQSSVEFTGESKRAMEAQIIAIREAWKTGKPVIIGPGWKVVPVVTFV